ncbi:hypothetical protein KBB08_04110 [Candidatus Gracilibacteria bacterium]|nr:hypothetical protein [Candidatus Gracilibacteria bacterium]
MDHKKSVVVIGSFRRHLSEIGKITKQFREQQIEVLSPISDQGINHGADFVRLDMDNPDKTDRALQTAVLAKITRADFVYVANIDGYLGHSAAGEVIFCALRNRPTFYHDPITICNTDIPQNVADVLRTRSQNIYNHQQSATAQLAAFEALRAITQQELDETSRTVLKIGFSQWLRSLSNKL